MNNKKNKILMVCCGGLNNGGSQNILMSIVRNLSDKYIFDIICTNTDSYYKEEFESYGGKIFYILEKTSNLARRVDYYIKYPREYYSALKIMRENGPYQAVHCHNYRGAAPFLHAAKKAGIGVRVAHSHSVSTTFKKRSKIYHFYEEMYRVQLLKYSTHKIGCSAAACDFLFGSDVGAQTVNNAIDLKRFDQNAFEDVSSSDAVRFVNVGKYAENKNQLFLLEVFREYLKLDPNAFLTLVGYGPNESIIKERSVEYGLESKMKMLPQDSNIGEVLSNSDFFVFPSKYEGLGIVLIEAQAMGLHCFASDVIPREADLGGCTFLSLDDGPEKWARNIYRHVKEYGKEKKQYDMSSYDIINVIKKYDDIYSS